jgi:hypothetical protein
MTPEEQAAADKAAAEKATQEADAETRLSFITAAVSAGEWIDSDVVETYLDRHVNAEGRFLQDGKEMTAEEVAEHLKKTKPHLVKAKLPVAARTTGRNDVIPTPPLKYADLLKPENAEQLSKMLRDKPEAMAKMREAHFKNAPMNLVLAGLLLFCLAGCRSIGNVKVDGSCMGRDGVISLKASHDAHGAGCQCPAPGTKAEIVPTGH